METRPRASLVTHDYVIKGEGGFTVDDVGIAVDLSTSH